MIFSTLDLKKEFTVYLQQQLSGQTIKPELFVFQIGENFVSEKYVSLKQKFAQKIGVEFTWQKFNPQVTLKELQTAISFLPENSGVIIQLPIDPDLMPILSQISSSKDVDLLNPDQQNSDLLAPTIGAIDLTLKSLLLKTKVLDFSNLLTQKLNLKGLAIAVIGQGKLVGKPATNYCLDRGAEVITIDINTPNPTSLTKKADIIITAAGSPRLITQEWVKPNAIILDASTSEQNGKLVGDVDVESMLESVTICTTPRGIGSLTVPYLFYNLLLLTNPELQILSYYS